MTMYLFKAVTRSDTGMIHGASYRQVEAASIDEAKKFFAKTYPTFEVHAVAEVIWEAPRVRMGPKTIGQFDKETRARKLSYGKLH